MSAVTPPPTARRLSASEVALRVLGVAVLASAPWLVTAVAWSLTRWWIALPALIVVAVARWRPRALLAGVLLAHQQVQRRRGAKTETAGAEVPATT
jgi:hypothetical protein